MPVPSCRSCSALLHHVFVDLGTTPLCESYVRAEDYDRAEPCYPLRAFVCELCQLVQVEALVSPAEIFTEYAYFSSYSETWVARAADYARTFADRLRLGKESLVVELGSNDGYLLQHFVAAGVPVLGIDPAANVAAAAHGRGVETRVAFFGASIARALVAEGLRADLIVANNVLAQVPDLHDFVSGIAILAKPRAVVTIEVPHLLRLIEGNQFDTIYHEHFSYFSLRSATKVLAAHGLRVFDVEEIATHGGSLRIHACHVGDPTKPTRPALAEVEAREVRARLDRIEGYTQFAERVKETKRAILDFLIGAKRDGRAIAGYGAPGKGNTLLNYCGIRTDFIDYTVDRNPYKQGKFLPGSRIPIDRPERIAETKPDYLFILPWNLADEVIAQMRHIRDWGGRFVVPIPTPRVIT